LLTSSLPKLPGVGFKPEHYSATEPRAWLEGFPLHLVGEIQFGRHDAEDMPSGPLLIDSHGKAVADPVRALFAEVIAKAGPMPTLVEWDNDLPEWLFFAAEAARAKDILAAGRVGFARAS
jgi:uncharacterized protein (UPF0276 family)